jgi:hypothetical protein
MPKVCFSRETFDILTDRPRIALDGVDLSFLARHYQLDAPLDEITNAVINLTPRD